MTLNPIPTQHTQPSTNWSRPVSGAVGALLCLAALAACGGGSSGGVDPAANPSGAGSPTDTTPPSGGTGGSSNPPASAAALSCDLPNFSKDMLDRVNAARAAGTACNGVAQPVRAALSWNTQLAAAAAAHSQDMAARNKMEHTGADGKGVGSRVTAQGYTWSWVGENIAAGQGSTASAMSSWLNSTSGHCESIMAKDVADIGVACVKATGGTPYWTMVLARPG
jgi:uncharacterized protein YkwD